METTKPTVFNYRRYVELVERIEEVKTEMCDEYCKHPNQCESEEALYAICERCPLDTLGGRRWSINL